MNKSLSVYLSTKGATSNAFFIAIKFPTRLRLEQHIKLIRHLEFIMVALQLLDFMILLIYGRQNASFHMYIKKAQ